MDIRELPKQRPPVLRLNHGADLKKTDEPELNDAVDFATQELRHVPTPISHAHCFVCGHSPSLGLRFHFSEGGVTARLHVEKEWQGYAGYMHGGMIATLLDAAMTHCLFHYQIEAMTADLQIRYIEPVPCAGAIDITARLTRQRRQIYELSAELCVTGQVKAHANAKFMRHKQLAKQSGPATSHLAQFIV